MGGGLATTTPHAVYIIDNNVYAVYMSVSVLMFAGESSVVTVDWGGGVRSSNRFSSQHTRRDRSD